MRISIFKHVLALTALALGVMPAATSTTQTPVDRADPSVVKEELRQDERTAPKRRQPIVVSRPQNGGADVGNDIVVGAIRVDGASVLQPAAFAPVIDNYIARSLSAEDLRNLASDVANVARTAGYGLATAWIPEQQVTNGVLNVVLDAGRIGSVEIQGGAERAVIHYIGALAHGRPVKTAELERQLLLAGDVAGVRVGKARLERRGGHNVLIVQATQKRVEGRAYADNWGSSTVGPIRTRLTVDFNGLLAQDDQLTVGGVITPLSPKEFGLVRLAYTKPIGIHGTEVTFGGYVANSQPGGVLSELDVDGRSVEFEAGIRHPFIRTRAGSLWGGLDLKVRDASQTRDGVKLRDDRLTLLSANAFAIHQLPNGRLRARMAAVQGLDLFDATHGGDTLASRIDGSGIFTKFEAWGEYEQELGRQFSFLAQVEGQVANRPLLSSEEMGLGGRYFGRAWDYREFSGDRGIAGSIELRYDLGSLPSPLRNVQVYGYGDAGSVGNYNGGTGGGSLASAGGGIRFWFKNSLEAGIEVGVPLTQGSNPLADRDPRLSFTVGKRF